MRKSFFRVALFIIVSSISIFAFNEASCGKFRELEGKDLCSYNRNEAVKYALKYYNLINEEDRDSNNPFGYYKNNCTNFVSQCLMAGLSGNGDIIGRVYASAFDFNEEKNEPLRWYFNDKYDSSSSWRGANELYKYAKISERDLYKKAYNGLKFKLITRDYISSYDKNGNRRKNGGALEVDKVVIGDIIFIDYKDKNGNYSKQNKKLRDIVTDGIMDHVFIVTNINKNARGYNKIEVTGNTTTYKNKGLGDINEDSNYNRKVEFYIFRPYFYIQNY